MDETIARGDLVRLKAGGPTMVAERVEHGRDCRVIWHSAEGILESACIPHWCLERVLSEQIALPAHYSNPIEYTITGPSESDADRFLPPAPPGLAAVGAGEKFADSVRSPLASAIDTR